MGERIIWEDRDQERRDVTLVSKENIGSMI